MALHSCAALTLLTAGFAGYPHVSLLVGTSDDVEPPFDAQVPTPPSNGGLTSEQVRQVVTLHAGALRALEGCVLRQIGSWVFPATIAAYPFRFGVTPSPRSSLYRRGKRDG
jgi:hypothetical protein